MFIRSYFNLQQGRRVKIKFLMRYFIDIKNKYDIIFILKG